jgi:HSP20 family protein
MLALRRLNTILDDAFTTWPFAVDGSAPTAAWVPAVDVTEDTDGVQIGIELPGVRPEEVNISLENGVLTIRGEKKQVRDARGDQLRRFERRYGSFERGFTLPTTVDVERIAARFEHGVLTVTLPRAEQAKPRRIEITTQA